MTRKAIIIAAHDTVYGPLPGALADTELYKEFLISPFGGAWTDSEVQVLLTPSLSKVQGALDAAQYTDYVFIAFSGHGEHVVGKSLNETRVCLNNSEDMSIIDLNPRSRRHIVVIDACRKVRTITETIEKMARAMFASESLLPDSQKCRELFDSAINDAEEGRIVIYSCQENQSAGEDSKGGVFTRALVQAGESWSVGTHRSQFGRGTRAVLGLDIAFEKAKTETYRVNAPQSPTWTPGRRMRHFPFAVVASDTILG
jgi:hypothetical protein